MKNLEPLTFNLKPNKGFTLIELLIYVAIFAILAIVFSSIMLTFTRINNSQTGNSEISSQLNFTTQTIQRLVNESSFAVVRSQTDGIDMGINWDEIDSTLGEAHKYLVLKTFNESSVPNDPNSPIVIYRDDVDNKIKIRQGSGTSVQISNLTTDKVIVDSLNFTKFVNYPGQDIIEIDLTMSYNSENPQQQISRSLVLGVSKATAAVFDTSLLPGADNSADVGQGTKRWRDGYFSGDLEIDGTASANVLNIGSGNPINGLYTGFVSVDPPNIPTGTNVTFTLTSPATVGASDRIFLTPPQDLNTGLIFVGARTIDASDEIEITIRNTAGGDINGTAKNWAYLLIK